MNTAPWWNQTIIGFDLETTGVALDSRIVTAAIIIARPGKPMESHNFLLNPGIDIPQGAAAIHGITTEHAAEHGTDYATGIKDIRDLLATHAPTAAAIAAFNAAFDFTILAAQCLELGLDTFTPDVVLDGLVMDRALDRWRRGSRTLVTLCAMHNIELDAHNADSDARGAILVAQALLNANPTAMSAAQFHLQCQVHRGRQQAGLQEHLRKSKGDPALTLDGGWPIYHEISTQLSTQN